MESAGMITPPPSTWSFAGVVSHAQAPTANHSKMLKQLETHWAASKSQDTATTTAAVSCLDRILVLSHNKADDATFQRLSKFMAQALAVSGGGFLQAPLLLHAALRSAVKDRHIRLRACQFVGAAMEALPPTAELEEDVIERVAAAMLARTRDKIVGVRAAAASALMRLQNPGDAACPVSAQLVRMPGAIEYRASSRTSMSLPRDQPAGLAGAPRRIQGCPRCRALCCRAHIFVPSACVVSRPRLGCRGAEE
jgi:hypothetical protein